MDHQKRAQADSLNRDLQNRPYDFDFFQAVRMLECTHPQFQRVGYSNRPQDDPVRFCQNASLAFAPAALQAYEGPTQERAARMIVNFFGLLGTNGPLPQHITEYVRDRLRNHADPTLAGFLDIFNHRMISLFYRAWACNQQTMSYDRPGDDPFAIYIGSLFGIGQDSCRTRDAVSDLAKLHYAGRLTCQTKNTEGLRELLHDYFGIEVEIHEFVGQWIDLPQEYCCSLGQSPDTGRVGATVIVGSRFWECQQKFRITFGPMSFSNYQRMLPGGDSICRLVTWVRNYVGDQLSCELQLILKADEVPTLRLGKVGRLGWSTWLGSKPFQKDADDLVLSALVA